MVSDKKGLRFSSIIISFKVDDSDPLWLQVKQQKCTIAQLKQSLQVGICHHVIKLRSCCRTSTAAILFRVSYWAFLRKRPRRRLISSNRKIEKKDEKAAE